MSRRKVANLLALAVLAYLGRAPMHPYELSKTLRAHGDDRSIKFTHGSVYMVVEQLVKAGLIAEQETSREGQRPERTVYGITPDGRAELQEWLRDLVGTPRHEYPAFGSALSLVSALHPDVVVELLRQRLVLLEEQRAAAAALAEAATPHPLFLVEEVYRQGLLEAEIAFVHRFIEQITDPATGWGPMWAAYHDTQ
ncbi:PadR family transcriptional regulator [Dactylosporangium aurantiacum]|uniref:PadR family transcriptional regulator n=1 Tax=Dactylosporangium aurantiacum TaxID=35754 RepID=A0A9Q9MQ53_9ACTN|nr:PadR family transcriptional regulator [Dactylosporangium aurantiacum]MDG6108570.1 PadR family transcriptional regulator [Dactylosporangium aurantiacum]UWZ57237.1 PadR family transcriptional regulator [Dactylosporangium aurantiacum]